MVQNRLHQNHVPDRRLHLEDLSIICKQSPLKITNNIFKISQSRQTFLKLTCMPLK